MRRTDPTFAGGPVVRVALQIGPLQQDVVVTAAATELPVSQVAAPVTVIDSQTLQALGKVDVLEPLRVVPGVQVIQTGPRGGTTSLFVRGGNPNFNKVLIDGVPANDVGGAFDFAQLATAGVESVEVLRAANSVLYGSDAMSGVISVTTRRGRFRVPEAAYSIDGGNLGTFRQAGSIAGAIKRFDYFSEIAHFRTDNDLENNDYRNLTYAGRFGVFAGTNTDVSGTVRLTDTEYGSPNSFNYFQIADDSRQNNTIRYASVTAQSQWNNRLRTTARYGVADQNIHYVNPTPTGERFDPFGFGASYLGKPVTITGANGYTVSGRAILDFGDSYPSVFDSTATRHFISGQGDYQVTQAFELSGGGRFEREHGTSESFSLSETTRKNGGAFVEGRVNILSRAYISGGIGVEHNAVFGTATTPRVSIAGFVRNPSSAGSVGDTKLTFNAGKGIKAPSLFQEQSSLFVLIPSGSPLATSVPPIGPERSRSFDVGIEQGFRRGQSRVRVAYFHNEFDDLLQFLSKSVLPQVGVPVAVANATPFGAYVNASSFTTQGVETSAEAVVGPVKIAGWYTFLDAEVTKSLSGGALSPAINPAFPGIPIGAFEPLGGARPFRRPTHSGNLLVSYDRGPAQAALSAFFSGKQDDSTFLSDPFFGNSMLLPNHNMDDAYQKVDLSAAYRVHRNLRWYVTVENLLNQKYEAASGFPALPTTVRTGVTIVVGGASGQTPLAR
jgi:vitamin B12 transporter